MFTLRFCASSQIGITFLHVMKLFSADEDGSHHLHLQHTSSEDASTEAHTACEWTLLVKVCVCVPFIASFWGWGGGLEAKSHIPDISEIPLGLALKNRHLV